MTERQDITCPKDGEPIPLDWFSIAKWSDDLYLIYCPRCNVRHSFTSISDAPGEEANK